MGERQILAELEGIVGRDGIVPWADVAKPMSQRLSQALREPPIAIAYPDSQPALAEVMTYAHREGWRRLICGAGSQLSWGSLTEVDLVISTARLNCLVENAFGDLTVTVEAGMCFGQLQKQLNQSGQLLGIDPAYPATATLGGIVATGDTGTLRQRYGSVRDMVIGISFVRHDGQIAKAGGRVVKNVAGYDLMKLFTGSYGSLGAIAQLTLRTYPMQDVSRTVLFSGSSESIDSLFKAVRRSPLTPVALDLLTPALAGTQEIALAARFQAIAAGVDEQVQRLLTLGTAENLKGTVFSDADDSQFWQQANEKIWGHPDAPPIVAKVGVQPTAAVDFLTQLPPSLPGRIHGRGVGVVQLAPEVSPAQLENLRDRLRPSGGYLTLLSAPRELRESVDIWGYHGNALSVMQAIKAQFDPQGCLSPGRFVGGI